MTSSETEIRDLLASIVGHEVLDGVGDDELIFERRIVDSLHLVELVSEIETRFRFEVQGNELTPENFASIRAMAAYVDSRATS